MYTNSVIKKTNLARQQMEWLDKLVNRKIISRLSREKENPGILFPEVPGLGNRERGREGMGANFRCL